MYRKHQLSFLLFILLLLAACTPKTTEPVQTTPPPQTTTPPKPPKPSNLSPCQNWSELANKEEVITWHSLYRDVMKKIRAAEELKDVNPETFDEMYENWKKVFAVAPAADGRRNTHYGDGIKIHDFLASKEQDPQKKDEYIKQVLTLYDEVIRCYGREGFTLGRKAFDLYYKYPTYATDLEKYEMFKRSFDLEEEDAPAFVFNPFTGLLSNLVLDGSVSMEEARSYASRMLALIEANRTKKTPTEWRAEGWDVVAEYTPARLEQLEGVQGFYGCDYYTTKYYPAFENAPTDCDSIVLALSRMQWGGCTGENPKAQAVLAAYRAQCEGPDTTVTCRSLLSQGKYQEAIQCFEERANNAEDSDVKAQNYLIAAKIYYGELKRYASARQYARKALEHRPNWGDPYILIGKLYASSGPLCGSGRGWPSQCVTWPAIDKWQRAKQVDPSVASEANRLIGRYRRYMPSIEDGFQRGIKEGDSFKVECWIQERTKARFIK